MNTIRQWIEVALRKWKFFRAIAEVATTVPDYNLEEQRELTAEEQAWLDEWIQQNS